MVKKVIYQLLLRAFGNRKCVPGGSYDINGSGKFNDITDEVLKKIRALSVDSIWYTGVISHATRTEFPFVPGNNHSLVKGEAGSPYAIRNWFDVDPALASRPDYRMSEFLSLVERTHKAGMKVIIDFIPNHVYREYSSYFKKENFYIIKEPLRLPAELKSDYVENPAKATGNDRFDAHPQLTDWYETAKLNYNSRDTWTKMLDILLFWAAKGVDGFRCDMVELVPSEFFGWAFDEVHRLYPDVFFIAEVYQKERYREYIEVGKFDLLYDKSGFYDTLKAVSSGHKPASEISHEWQFLADMQPRMLNFLENHDEVRVASDFFAGSGRASLPLLAVSLLFNTAPFMLYFGQEFGERGMESEGFSGVDGRTSIFDYCIVPSVRRWLMNRLEVDEQIINREYLRLLKIATADSVFSKGATYDLMYANPRSDKFNPDVHFAWIRAYGDTAMLIVANFARESADVHVFIPQEAFDFLKIDNVEGYFHVRVNSRDYTRIDISR